MRRQTRFKTLGTPAVRDLQTFKRLPPWNMFNIEALALCCFRLHFPWHPLFYRFCFGYLGSRTSNHMRRQTRFKTLGTPVVRDLQTSKRLLPCNIFKIKALTLCCSRLRFPRHPLFYRFCFGYLRSRTSNHMRRQTRFKTLGTPVVRDLRTSKRLPPWNMFNIEALALCCSRLRFPWHPLFYRFCFGYLGSRTSNHMRRQTRFKTLGTPVVRDLQTSKRLPPCNIFKIRALTLCCSRLRFPRHPLFYRFCFGYLRSRTSNHMRRQTRFKTLGTPAVRDLQTSKRFPPWNMFNIEALALCCSRLRFPWHPLFYRFCFGYLGSRTSNHMRRQTRFKTLGTPVVRDLQTSKRLLPCNIFKIKALTLCCSRLRFPRHPLFYRFCFGYLRSRTSNHMRRQTRFKTLGTPAVRDLQTSKRLPPCNIFKIRALTRCCSRLRFPRHPLFYRFCFGYLRSRTSNHMRRQTRFKTLGTPVVRDLQTSKRLLPCNIFKIKALTLCCSRLRFPRHPLFYRFCFGYLRSRTSNHMRRQTRFKTLGTPVVRDLRTSKRLPPWNMFNIEARALCCSRLRFPRHPLFCRLICCHLSRRA